MLLHDWGIDNFHLPFLIPDVTPGLYQE